jgi:hypothetical protein
MVRKGLELLKLEGLGLSEAEIVKELISEKCKFAKRACWRCFFSDGDGVLTAIFIEPMKYFFAIYKKYEFRWLIQASWPFYRL